MSCWVEQEVAGAQMKDQRLKARLGQVLSQLSHEPERSIAAACKQWGDVLGAYRFFDNDRVGFEDVLSGHKAATLSRMADQSVILVAQDTTFLNFDSLQAKEGFGTIKEAVRDEHLLHVNVAFTDQRVNLGVLSGRLWQRTGEGIAQLRKQRPTKDKESQRWLDGYAVACDVQAHYPQKWVISVADREGDIHEWYELAQDTPSLRRASYIVRAKQQRRIQIQDDEHEDLWEWLAAQPVLGRYEIAVPAKGGRSARVAQVRVRAGEVTLSGRIGASVQPVTLHAVLASEEDAPAGVSPICWRLLSDIPADSYESARAIIEWYRCRWEIEIFFRVIKNACQLEALRLQTAPRLYNAIAVYLIIAWRLHLLTMQARERPQVACDEVLSAKEWQTIYIMHKRKPPPEKPPTLRQATRMLASLGGFLGRKGDGEPGTKTIWIGYANLLAYITAIDQVTAVRGKCV
jgi:hypothetical protein